MEPDKPTHKPESSDTKVRQQIIAESLVNDLSHHEWIKVEEHQENNHKD